jgi:hypothetical protein
MPAPEPSSERALSDSLIHKIFKDIRQLVEQQYRLKQIELKDQIREHQFAGGLIVLAVVLVGISVVLIAESLVYFLHWMTSNIVADPSWLPLWSCYVVISIIFMVSGFGLLRLGVLRLKIGDYSSIALSEKSKEHHER